ncbi:MAG: carbon-nitrogen hydrolase family protein [Cyclobacteriaceae bacterium]|nr:carbon-nitrogen hydrolase family protein [Cyclobacteriaceae bacterium]
MKKIRKIYQIIQVKLTIMLLMMFCPGQECLATGRAMDDLSGWQFSSQRKEIAPDFFIDKENRYKDLSTLALKGNGKSYVNGHWFRIINVNPGTYCDFSTHYLTEKVEEENRCVLARIIWLDKESNQTGMAEYPALTGIVNPDGWREIRQVYKVPGEAVQARIELIYRWDEDGTVRFGGTEMNKAENPLSRIVRLATIHHRPANNRSSEENLEEFKDLIVQAASGKADIVCLPEAITLAGTPHDYISASEPVPGPTTRFLGELAKEHRMYIVAGILEREDEVVYNTAILMDRNGDLAGKYRKLSLPREEIEGGVTPGDRLPVFDTDFGRIGIMICWDVTFPETARALAVKGAEIIFLPIWGGNLVLTRARAIENQVYLVSSTYDMKSAIFDLEGEILEEATDKKPVIVAEVDLNRQKLWPWLGDFKNRIPREMPPRKAVSLDK